MHMNECPIVYDMLITLIPNGTSGISDLNTIPIPMGSGVAIENHNG